jgi:2,3-bisphosphoglycerate-independent phosphoglycerate mutase
MKAKKKIVLVLIDGMGDRPIKALRNMTPLEAARTPNMDFMAKNGKTGMMYPVSKGIAPESDVATMAILGYEPLKYYSGRGPIEALGVGIKTRFGELTLRGNFVTIDKNWKILDIRAGRIKDKEAKELVEALEDIELTDAEFTLKHLGGYRFMLKIRAKKAHLSPKITNVHPGYLMPGLDIPVAIPPNNWKIVKSEPLSNSRGAVLAANLVNEFIKKSYSVLKNHPINKRKKNPANCVVLRDPGNRLPTLPSFEQRYGQIWLVMAEKPVELGLGSLAGMDSKPFPAGKYDNVAAMVNEALEYYDGVYLHLKATDNAGHDGNYKEKISVLERIDKKVISKIDRSAVICITADHSTPCELKSHSEDPVPLLIYGGKSDKVKKFGESFCNQGSLKMIRGVQLLDLLVKTACTLQ